MADGKAVLFVDGRYLHGALKRLQLQERDVNWDRFFDEITPEGHMLVRSYWYYPARIARSDRRHYSRRDENGGDNHGHENNHENNHEQAASWLAEQELRHRKIREEVHPAIADSYERIEFRYVGILRVNATNQEYLGEKGVDVGMAVDLVSKADRYDTALVITGDQDLAPAVQYVKDRLRQVILVTIQPNSSTMQIHASRRLRVLADRLWVFEESDFNNKELGLKL